MTGSTIFGLLGCVLTGIGLCGLILHGEPLRKILAFSILGGGTFLLFGVVAQRGGAGAGEADPVPQAMVITGIVVAFAATALAITFMQRIREQAEIESKAVRRPRTSPSAMIGADDIASGRAASLLILAIILPAVAVLAIVAAGARFARLIVAIQVVLGTIIAVAIVMAVHEANGAIVFHVGAWKPPLGIALRADGLAATWRS